MQYTKGRLYKLETNNDADSLNEVEETHFFDIFGRMPAKTTKVADYDNYVYTTYYEYDFTGHVTKMTYPYNSGGGGGQMAVQSGSSELQNLVIQDMTLEPGSEKVIESEGDIIITGEFNSNEAEVIATPGVSKKPEDSYVASTNQSAYQSQLLFDGGGMSAAMSSPDPNATVVTYTYNTLGQLYSIGNASDIDYFAAYTYNPDGSMATEKMKDTTIKRIYTYEQLGWLKSITDSLFADTLYYTNGGYGGSGYYNGNIARMKIDYKFGGSPSDYVYLFKYDKLSQLLVADHSMNNAGDMGVGTGNENKYDGNGNFIRVITNTTTKTYNYYSNTNKVQNTDGSGNDYVYDQIGNVVTSSPKSISTLVYDPFINRTKSISMTGASLSFEYDGTDRRVYVAESPANSKVLYLHDGMNSIQERSNSGGVTEYVYGPTGIIAFKTSTTWKYLIKDHLGSTRAVVDGAVVTGYDYSAFGNVLAPTMPNTNTNYMFTGQEYDKTSGLHNFKARMYDSDLGRFYGVDPAEQYSSPFSYVGSNPINIIDPSGKKGYDLKNLIPGYGLYALGRNMYRAYNQSGGGLYGFLMAYSVANRGVISMGFTAVTTAATGNVLAGAGIGGLIGASASGAAGGASGAAAGGGNIRDGAINGVIDGMIKYGSAQAKQYLQNSRKRQYLSQAPSGPDGEVDPSKLDPEQLRKFTEKKFGAKNGDLALNEIHIASESQKPVGWRITPNKLLGNRPNWVTRFFLGENEAYGVTMPSEVNGKSDIWIAPGAFVSETRLYYTVGHELIHAALIHQGKFDINMQEHSAWGWQYSKALQMGDMDIAAEAQMMWRPYGGFSGYPYPGSAGWQSDWFGF